LSRCWSPSWRSSCPLVTRRWRMRPRRLQDPPTSFAVSTLVHWARPVAPSPPARRCSMTRFRPSPSLIPRSSVRCAELRKMRQTSASSSSSTAVGVPRRTRKNCCARPFRSTARSGKRSDGWRRPTRRLTFRGTRSTSAPPMPRRGSRDTEPTTGCARSTATKPGTTNYVRKPSITVARPCTPTPRTIRGCSSERL
jgi:hypothetical protein